MHDVMIDLETLGTTADAVILSIGAVKFDLNSDKIQDEAFYASVSVESNLNLKRRVSEDTLLWWMKQTSAAQAVFFEPKQTLETALEDLSDWIANDKCTVWSNGADFDLPMLAHAFTTVGIEIPWKFWNSRCVRTYKSLPVAKRTTMPDMIGTKHNAMADAYHQAQVVQAIQATMNNEAKMKVKA